VAGLLLQNNLIFAAQHVLALDLPKGHKPAFAGMTLGKLCFVFFRGFRGKINSPYFKIYLTNPQNMLYFLYFNVKAEDLLMPVTLKDVAKHANCSHTTVSLALRGSSEISKETVKTVLKSVSELGYVTNQKAKGLRTSKSMAVGIISDAITQPSKALLLQAIAEKLQIHGYTPILGIQSVGENVTGEFISRVIGEQIDGLICIEMRQISNHEISPAIKNNIPIVSVLNHINGTSFIGVDKFQAGKIAGEHLLSLGFERAGYLKEEALAYEDDEKLHGFEAALKQNGSVGENVTLLPFNSRGVKGWYQAGFKAGVEFAGLKDKEHLKAVFIPSGAVTFGFLQAVLKAGLKVPEDVTIVGYEALPESECQQVALTMVEQPWQEVANRAVDNLMQQIDKNSPAAEKVLSHKLVIRESSGNNS